MNWIRIKALVWHYLNTVKRNKGRLIDLLVWPLLDVLVFGFTANFVRQESGYEKIVYIILGSLVFWHFFSRITGEVYQQIFDDVASKNLRNIMITPIENREIVLALSIGAIVKVVVSLIVTVMAVVLFYRFDLMSLNIYWWQLAVLVSFGLAVGFLIASLLFVLGMKAMSFGWVLTGLIQPFCCVFYSRSVLPAGLKELSYLVPVSYVFEAYRGVFINWLLPTGLALVMLVASIVVFLWFVGLSRKTGVLSRI